jgi:hypothetical protein
MVISAAAHVSTFPPFFVPDSRRDFRFSRRLLPFFRACAAGFPAVMMVVEMHGRV